MKTKTKKRIEINNLDIWKSNYTDLYFKIMQVQNELVIGYYTEFIWKDDIVISKKDLKKHFTLHFKH